MTCQEIADYLMQYLEGELTPSQQETFEMHLQECPDCMAYLESYAMTIKASQSAYSDDGCFNMTEIPEDLVNAILASQQVR